MAPPGLYLGHVACNLAKQLQEHTPHYAQVILVQHIGLTYFDKWCHLTVTNLKLNKSNDYSSFVFQSRQCMQVHDHVILWMSTDCVHVWGVGG